LTEIKEERERSETKEKEKLWTLAGLKPANTEVYTSKRPKMDGNV